MPTTNPYSRRPPREGETTFRLLCSNYAAGGIIGHSGHVVMRLEKQTSCIIDVDVAVTSSAKERIVHVTGSTSLTRTLNFADRNLRVSAAQEGLFRVLERVVEAEAEVRRSGDLSKKVKCRLLVGPGVRASLLGNGAEFVSRISKQTGAFIMVWKGEIHDNLPPCAAPTDELIQMTGDSIAVKKALLVLTGHLQKKGVDTDKRLKARAPDAPMNNAVNGGAGEEVAKVSFKLLCPYGPAGWIIGTKGKAVKALEQETGASITFLPLGDGCDERVAVVSASEKRNSQYSCTQNAVARIFNEVFQSEEMVTATARLLILPNQSDWLRSGGSSVLSEIQNATGATLKVHELDYSPLGASADEKVLQIDGDQRSVQVSLFQVSCKLRERAFEPTIAKRRTPTLPHKLFNGPSKRDEIAALTDDLNSCRVSEESSSKQCSTASSASSRDLATIYGGSGFGSGSKSAMVVKTKLEIAVREDVFGAVYGEKGSNLARLRQISGATVEVHDPCGGSEGKVIISGTRDQTMVAQSLLQTFLVL